MNRVFIYHRRTKRAINVRLSRGILNVSPKLTYELTAKETEILTRILLAQADCRLRAEQDVWEFDWNNEI
jgi:hypothetical protein